MPVNDFDAVIVGSGFGGAVMAHRLAEAGMRVCVLERGKAYPPGSFPRSPHALGRNWWDPSRGLYGMFQAWSFANIEAIVASGLGGGSLIYANVLLRKDEHWFREQEADGSYRNWPVTRAELDPHYDRVEQFLNAQRYPIEHQPYSDTPKTIAFRNAAEKLKAQGARLDWFLPPLAVTFANRDRDGKLKTPVPGVSITDVPGNLHQSERFTCRLCGECDIGCNYGSKNTLDLTYLSAASRANAEIRTLCEVKRFRPNAGGPGYAIEYTRHRPSSGQSQLETITADRLILAAGTLGTTYLLLKNRAAFPKISERLGDRFSTNGDLLTFASRATADATGTAVPRNIDPSHGPVITSTIRVGDTLDGQGDTGRGFYLQDAGYPEFVNWVIETANAPGVIERALRFAGRRLRQWWTGDPQTEVSAQLARLIGNAENSSGSMPLLGMGRDLPDGKMSLRSNRKGDQFLQVDWARPRSSAYFDGVTALSRKIAETMGATHIENPSTGFLGRLVTVHPLGGCAMGPSAADGVVDSRGGVFNYPGLYVADGSVMPGPVGANPSLTIAALADLFADDIVNEFHASQRMPRPRDKPAPDSGGFQSPNFTTGEPAMTSSTATSAAGVQFTETMRGYLSMREKTDFESAEAAARADNRRFSFTVTITIDDVARFTAQQPAHGKIEGTVEAPEISPLPLTVAGGEFNLFLDDARSVNTKEMRYSMRLHAGDGKDFYLYGFKTIRNDAGFDLWSDTTTLRIRLYEGSDDSGIVLGLGILTISAADFLRQMTTLKAVNARNQADGLRAIGQFGALFAGALYDTYGAVFSRPTVFDPAAPPRRRRRLDLPVAPEVYQVDAGDGVLMRLTRYKGGAKGPVMCVHGLGVSSRIFSTDLIDRNLLEELVANRYDVWLLDYRSSIDLPYAARQYSADDVATKDFPAAVAFIRKTAAVPSIQCLVHCFGATTFFMAMLAGLQGVRAAAVSQIAMDMQVSLASELKAIFHAPEFLQGIGVENLNAYVDAHEGLLGRTIDQLLRFYPVHDGPRDISAVSRRISFIYGQLYEVDQLNQQTYDNLHELFGVASIDSLKHLALMIRHKKIVDADGGDSYLQEAQGMWTLKQLAIPIAIAQGALNKCWLTESTSKSIERLSKVNGSELYRRELIPGYGHIDCIFGKNAARDVYPFFIRHLDTTAQA